MLMPEVILYNSLQGLLDMMTLDWTNTVDKSRTTLSDLFAVDDNGQVLQIDTYNYFTQAQAILLRTSNSPKKLEINIGYNMQRQALPTVHILMPSESKGNMDSIGDSEGEPVTVIDGDQLIITKTKSTSVAYHLMITSDNSSEVLLVYYFLKGMMMLNDAHFELSGFKNFQFSGSDINMQQDLAPNNVFHRNLSVSFSYNSSVKIRQPYNNVTGMTFGVCEDIVDDFYPPGQEPPTFTAPEGDFNEDHSNDLDNR